MPWGHIDDKTLEFASGNTLKGFCHDLMVPSMYKRRPDMLDII